MKQVILKTIFTAFVLVVVLAVFLYNLYLVKIKGDDL